MQFIQFKAAMKLATTCREISQSNLAGRVSILIPTLLMTALSCFLVFAVGCEGPPLPQDVALAKSATVASEPKTAEAPPSVPNSVSSLEPQEPRDAKTLFPLDSDMGDTDKGAAPEPKVTQPNQESGNQESDPAAPTEAEPSMLQKAGSLFNKAKSKGAAAASGTSKWVQEKLGAAAETGEQTAEDTMKWATETFQSLKDQGLTTAKDTSEWLSDDWSNMDSWQYHVEKFDGEATESIVAKMNELGKDGWECFHINGQNYFFKKPTQSYLRSLPFKDVIKLVPLMGAAGSNNDK